MDIRGNVPGNVPVNIGAARRLNAVAGKYAIAGGVDSESAGVCTIAARVRSESAGVWAIVAGFRPESTGVCPIATGIRREATGVCAIATGVRPEWTGVRFIATGVRPESTGDCGVSSGKSCILCRDRGHITALHALNGCNRRRVGWRHPNALKRSPKTGRCIRHCAASHAKCPPPGFRSTVFR